MVCLALKVVVMKSSAIKTLATAFLAVLVCKTLLAFSPACPSEFLLPCDPARRALEMFAKGTNSLNADMLTQFAELFTNVTTQANISDPMCCFVQELRRCMLTVAHEKHLLGKLLTMLPRIDGQLRQTIRPTCDLAAPKLKYPGARKVNNATETQALVTPFLNTSPIPVSSVTVSPPTVPPTTSSISANTAFSSALSTNTTFAVPVDTTRTTVAKITTGTTSTVLPTTAASSTAPTTQAPAILPATQSTVAAVLSQNITTATLATAPTSAATISSTAEASRLLVPSSVTTTKVLAATESQALLNHTAVSVVNPALTVTGLKLDRQQNSTASASLHTTAVTPAAVVSTIPVMPGNTLTTATVATTATNANSTIRGDSLSAFRRSRPTITIEGWTAHCSQKMGFLELPSPSLPNFCRELCRTTPGCAFVTVTANRTKCVFIGDDTECQFLADAGWMISGNPSRKSEKKTGHPAVESPVQLGNGTAVDSASVIVCGQICLLYPLCSVVVTNGTECMM